MKTPLLTIISLFVLAGATFAGPLFTKTPPSQPVLPPSPASGGWYWGVTGGYLWLNDATFCGCQDLNYRDGWGTHGVVAYHFSNGLSLGVSAGYLSGQFDAEEHGHVVGSGDLHMVPIMVNASYNMNLTDTLSLYLGGGIGTAWSELEGVDGAGEDGDWHLAWQGRAGFGYKVNNGLILNLGYRYISVENAMSAYGDAAGHMAEAGFKVNF